MLIVSALFIYTIFSTNPLIIKRIFLLLHLRIKPIISAFISFSPMKYLPASPLVALHPLQNICSIVSIGTEPTPIKPCPHRNLIAFRHNHYLTILVLQTVKESSFSDIIQRFFNIFPVFYRDIINCNSF